MQSQRVRHNWVTLTFTIQVLSIYFRSQGRWLLFIFSLAQLLLKVQFSRSLSSTNGHLVPYPHGTFSNIFGFASGTVVKNLPSSSADIRDVGLICGLGRSPGVGHGNPLLYCFPENPMDRGAWWATVYGEAESISEHSWRHFCCYS